jgi:hypothetical protein
VDYSWKSLFRIGKIIVPLILLNKIRFVWWRDQKFQFQIHSKFKCGAGIFNIPLFSTKLKYKIEFLTFPNKNVGQGSEIPVPDSFQIVILFRSAFGSVNAVIRLPAYVIV